jgi:transposase
VFLDESGFTHHMPRTHGYSVKGLRSFGTYDWNAKKRTNVIGALIDCSLLTVSLFQTTINTLVFNEWIITDLLPKLPPQSVVVLDNATFHKGREMQEAIASEGHSLLYLPAYSPDLNPIEKKWAQAKSLRRKLQCPIDVLFNRSEL